MVIALTILHVLVCFFLVIVVLLQSGKAADLAGAFGGMGSQTAFGPRGSATVLSKATTTAAAIFMMTSIALSILSTKQTGTGTSVLETQAGQVQQQETTTPPATPPAGQASQPATGQPSVTVTDPATGESRTIPLELPPPGQSSSGSEPSSPGGQAPNQ